MAVTCRYELVATQLLDDSSRLEATLDLHPPGVIASITLGMMR